MADLVIEMPVALAPAQVWGALTAWDRQDEWMLGTRVRSLDGAGHAEGARLVALTGVAGLGLLDRMRVTRWDPPRVCEVEHVGKVLRGSGIFEVRPEPDGTSTVVWTEVVDLPFGALGRLGWVVVKPMTRIGVVVSLRRFARWAADYR